MNIDDLTCDDLMQEPEPGDVVIPFGKSNGKTIGQIASSDKGLWYLDWLVGQKWLNEYLRVPLELYLSDPAIKAELRRILGQE